MTTEDIYNVHKTSGCYIEHNLPFWVIFWLDSQHNVIESLEAFETHFSIFFVYKEPFTRKPVHFSIITTTMTPA